MQIDSGQSIVLLHQARERVYKYPIDDAEQRNLLQLIVKGVNLERSAVPLGLSTLENCVMHYFVF